MKKIIKNLALGSAKSIINALKLQKNQKIFFW
jgi:hypothetical protein